MPFVSQTIPSFKGGVSQQPALIRFPDQLEEQINGFSSEVDGLQKRPPLMFIKKLVTSTDNSNARWHIIDRDKDEQYIMKLVNGALEVWDLQGNKKTVKYSSGTDYLNIGSSSPFECFRCVTVADYTFVLNRNKVCKMTSAKTSNVSSDKTLCYVKNAQYSKTYAVYNGDTFLAAVQTPDGSDAKQAQQTTTAYIARSLLSLLNGTNTKPNYSSYDEIMGQTGGATNLLTARASGSGYDKFNWSLEGESVIVCQSKDGSRPNLKLKDGFGLTNFIVVKGAVSAVNKLPPNAPNGYLCKIRGESSDDDDYWVKWDDTEALWKESAAPNVPYHIDPNTMPHALIREADGTFTFKTLEWYDREVGDEDSNPDPSFIGHTINDIFFYRNRLGFISEESVILSETATFFNYWYKSVTAIADTDVIDLSVSSNKVAILTAAIPFSRELMLFSNEGQFVLGSDGVMTPKNVKVDQITSFSYSDEVQPIDVGQSIFFINNRINYCSLMRFYTVQDVADLKDAEDTSQHIPTYIPVGIKELSGNTTYNTILCTHKTLTRYLWVYKYIIQNGEPLQQSWSKWDFGEGKQIILAKYVGAKIYFVIYDNYTGNIVLEYTQLSGNAVDFSNEPFRIFIDDKVLYDIPSSATYDDYNDKTQINLNNVYGQVSSQTITYTIVDTDGYAREVEVINGLFWLDGDWRGKSVFIGLQYSARFTLSQVMLRQNNNGSVVGEDEGRLLLRYFWFNTAKSGVYKTIVAHSLRGQQYEYLSTNKVLDLSNNVLGDFIHVDNKYKFPVQRPADEVKITIESSYPTPLNIISGGWEGMYIRRNQKV